MSGLPSLEQCAFHCLSLFRYKFKARPLNPEVFQKAGFYGVPKKRVEMSLTVPQSPQLFTDERIKKSHKEEDQHEQPVFQARPVPRDIFERIKV